MKDRLWNTLSVLGLISICVVIGVTLLILLNPQVFLNPFPPPTKVPLVVIPTEEYTQTSTSTLLGLPATWTVTIDTRPTATLIPSSTPFPTRTLYRLPTNTPTRTPTRTYTVTRTPSLTRTKTRTNTPTLTRTPTPSPTITDTPADTDTATFTFTPTETFTPVTP